MTTKPKRSRIIDALISEIPDSNSNWPVDKQMSWLKLMAIAFGTVYGGDAASLLEAQTGRAQAPDISGAEAATTPEVPSPPPPKKPDYKFCIDEQGFAMKANGKRIMPSDVSGEIVDLRGETGDMRTIIWADDSQGINGVDLTVRPLV